MGGSWGNDPTGDENDLICVRVADFDFGNRTLKRKDFTVRNFTPSEQASRLLQKGDLILEKSGGGEKTPVGRVVKFDLNEAAICSNFTNRLIPKSAFDSDFLIYLFFALYSNGVTLSHINQTTGIQNLQVSSFLDETVFIPISIPEQRAIAAYLDRKTAQIDTLLAQKEALLQRLQQQRQAIINEAVTQGLDPAAPRKPSGVAWLGDVPAHWEVRRMKMLSTFVTSGSRGWAEYYSDEGEVFLRIGNLSTSSIDLKLHNLKYVTPPAGAEGARTSVQENDLLISITALLGAIGVVPKEMQDAYVNQHIALVRLKLDLINPRWAAYFLISAVGQHQFRTLTNGGTKEGLTLGDIASLLLLYPPKDEQQAIVDFIEAKIGKINEAAAAIRTQINVLKTYRQSLISEVVTGKVDVRPAAVEALAAGTQTRLWS